MDGKKEHQVFVIFSMIDSRKKNTLRGYSLKKGVVEKKAALT